MEKRLYGKVKRKIAIVTFYFVPQRIGGIEIATYNIAKHLAQKGYEVHIITSLDKGMPENSNEYGFTVHRLSYYKKNRIIKIMQFWYKIFFNIYTLKPDIVHIQGVGNGIPAFFAKLICKVPYVVMGHGSDVYLAWPLKNVISKIVLKHADVVIALTVHMKKEIKKIYLRSVEVVANGIDVKRFYINNDKENVSFNRKTILFVGTLHSIKGVKYLIRAVNLIRNKYNVELVIIGNGEEEDELKELANNLNLNDSVHFMGRIDNNKIPEYMAKADIFVLPSLSEGLPVVILEAMASGLPIIASNVRGLSEIVEEGVNGFLVGPGNPEHLADKIILLLDDDGLRSKISRANREKAKRYDWRCIVEQLEKIYSSVWKRS